MGEMIALARKDIRLLLGDKAGAFFTLVFPLIVAVFFGAIFSGGEGSRALRVALVDEDATAESAGFVAELEEAEELELARVQRGEGEGAPWELPTREEAAEMVRRGKVAAYVLLPPGFGAARERMFWGEPARVEVGIDPSRKGEAAMLQGVLTKHLFASMQEAFGDPGVMRERLREGRQDMREGAEAGMPPGLGDALDRLFEDLEEFLDELPEQAAAEGAFAGWQPLEIETRQVLRQREGPANHFQVSFPQGMLWGMLAACASFGIGLVEERTKGTLVRLRMAPIGRAQILGGKALACFLSAAGVCAMLLAVAAAFFGVRPSSLGLLALAVVCSAGAFVGMMMALSALAKTERAAGGIGWAVLMMLTMVGGGSVPLFIMPPWLQKVSYFSPMRWSVLALEGAIWRGFSLREMLVPCAVLLGVGAVCFALGVRAFRWMQEG